jgi:hypothetical protein
LARVDAFIRDWHAFAGTGDAPAPQHVGVSQPSDARSEEAQPEAFRIELVSPSRLPDGARRRRPRNPSKEEVAAKVREILNFVGHPLTRPELLRRLNDDGVVIEGANPDVVLSTMLWRMRDRIVHHKGHGYWLAERALPSETVTYEHGDRVELRKGASGPWAEKGTIVGPTLPSAGSGEAPQWMVKVDGQHGARPVPGECVRRLAEGQSDNGEVT